MSLKEIYPVINLQYSDILDSRRSVLSYLDDIEKGSITFRKYQFKNEKYTVFNNVNFIYNFLSKSTSKK